MLSNEQVISNHSNMIKLFKISFCSLNPLQGQSFCVKCQFFPTGPSFGQCCSKGSVPHKLISRLVWLVQEIWGESLWFQRASSLSVLVIGCCSVTRCWPGLGRAGLSGWSSCRVIPLSDIVLGPDAQRGRQVPLRPVTQQTKHTGIWHQCQQLRAIKSSHMIPIHFIPY